MQKKQSVLLYGTVGIQVPGRQGELAVDFNLALKCRAHSCSDEFETYHIDD